ncbi:integrase catalytic domain-containing protein [Trichonephila clavipes]|nr:integrase catalytic domain-containing protein [Trichonephila clavipes]
MNRVPFGVTLSPLVLAATIKFHIRKYKEDYRETYEMLNTSLYVDDLFAGSSEFVNKAFDLSKNTIEILKDANMNLRKFKINSKELRKLWNENGIGDACESGERSLKSDSSIALHWIKGKASNYKQFVSNRVIEIQSNSDLSDWYHCSGRENPADYVSRGANLETIINSQFWMHGPQWLRTTENNWPKNLNCDFSSTDPCECKEQVFTFACELNTVSTLQRFISRRGLCSKILTDNANNFKKSELELKNLWKTISDPTVKAFYASHKIYWQFIIERAPWWGGFYERLIRTLKLALRKTVGRATLFRDELETLLIEIEVVLNSRPLTYIFSEFNEPEPLTPSHMILGRRVNSLPPARLNFDSNLSNRKVLRGLNVQHFGIIPQYAAKHISVILSIVGNKRQ